MAFIYILKSYRKKILFKFFEKKYVQFITCIFLLKSMYLLKFWKIFFSYLFTPIFYLFAKMNKKWEIFFIFFTRYWERNNQNHFHSVEIGNRYFFLLFQYLKNYTFLKKWRTRLFKLYQALFNQWFLKGVLIHWGNLISPENWDWGSSNSPVN